MPLSTEQVAFLHGAIIGLPYLLVHGFRFSDFGFVKNISAHSRAMLLEFVILESSFFLLVPLCFSGYGVLADFLVHVISLSCNN